MKEEINVERGDPIDRANERSQNPNLIQSNWKFDSQLVLETSTIERCIEGIFLME